MSIIEPYRIIGTEIGNLEIGSIQLEIGFLKTVLDIMEIFSQ